MEKLTTEIHYNGGDFHFYAHYLEHNSVDQNRKEILNRIKQNLILPEIPAAEKEIILNAEKETMEMALQLFEIYKQNIDATDEEKKHSLRTLQQFQMKNDPPKTSSENGEEA